MNNTLKKTSVLPPQFPLAPGFSRVSRPQSRENRFNGFPSPASKAVETALLSARLNTRLKPGANGRAATRRCPAVALLAAALLCVQPLFAQVKTELKPVPPKPPTPAAVPVAPKPPAAPGLPGAPAPSGFSTIAPVLAPPVAPAPRKLSSFETPVCVLEEAVRGLQTQLQLNKMEPLNILFGPDTKGLEVQELNLHNVTGADALQFLATSAGCTVEPMYSTETSLVFVGGAIQGQKPQVIGYTFRAKPKPPTIMRALPGAGGPPSSPAPVSDRMVGGPPRSVSATSPAGRLTRIYPLGSVTGLKTAYKAGSSYTRDFHLDRYFRYQIDFPELEKTLREALKADGVAENQITLAIHEKSNVLVVNATESVQGLIEQVLAALRSNAAEAEAKNMERDKALGRAELEAAVGARQRLEEVLAQRGSELRDLQKRSKLQDAAPKPPSAK